MRNSCPKILGTKGGGQFFNYLGDKGWEDKAGEKYILGTPGQRVGEKAGEKQLFRNLEDKESVKDRAGEKQKVGKGDKAGEGKTEGCACSYLVVSS